MGISVHLILNVLLGLLSMKKCIYTRLTEPASTDTWLLMQTDDIIKASASVSHHRAVMDTSVQREWR